MTTLQKLQLKCVLQIKQILECSLVSEENQFQAQRFGLVEDILNYLAVTVSITSFFMSSNYAISIGLS